MFNSYRVIAIIYLTSGIATVYYLNVKKQLMRMKWHRLMFINYSIEPISESSGEWHERERKKMPSECPKSK